MAKKNTNKATKQRVTETAAKPSGRAAKIDETAAERAKALKSPLPAVTAKSPVTPASLPLQTPTPVTASKPIQSSAQRVPKAPASAVAAQGSLTPPAPSSPKPPAQPAPIKLAAKAVVVAEAPRRSDVPTVKVTFVFPSCECGPQHVSLSGDFNGWSVDATPMTRCGDGHWETTVDLAPGRYEYKFVRDGEWMPDLLARENVLNRHGTLNSVIEVRAS
jgi:hypothetical protein